ncbi:hypothetical protein WA026_015257 [Henosepilachna vigintioctopunctata]|uniref:J domain-containing protein n=1 Tax=Henosepilachna vigintioctopunctata TaxID=420089 RepID=A0AAW1TWD0_9CUCU
MFSINLLKNYSISCYQSCRSISLFRCVRAKNFYDSLEITPRATQAEIKEAYYKLSMIYHPDKNSRTEASQKFRDISEAYEVLRNVRLRKLYDKGLFPNTSSIADDNINKFYKSRNNRSQQPATGRTPIYDFDEWSRSHYGATLARDFERKKRKQREAEIRFTDQEDIKKEKVAFCAFCLMMMAGYLFFQEDFDKSLDDFKGPHR